MPNWCMNSATITASTPEQKELLAKIANRGEDEGVFDTIRPLPEALRDTVKGTGEELQEVYVDGCNNWYDWQVAHWGTKWDIDPFDAEFDGTTLQLNFDSAWSPPVTIYEFLQEQGFKVYATYAEPGMCFAGVWDNGDDMCIEDMSSELESDDPVVQSLIEEYNIHDWFDFDDDEGMLIDEA